MEQSTVPVLSNEDCTVNNDKDKASMLKRCFRTMLQHSPSTTIVYPMNARRMLHAVRNTSWSQSSQNEMALIKSLVECYMKATSLNIATFITKLFNLHVYQTGLCSPCRLGKCLTWFQSKNRVIAQAQQLQTHFSYTYICPEQSTGATYI